MTLNFGLLYQTPGGVDTSTAENDAVSRCSICDGGLVTSTGHSEKSASKSNEIMNEEDGIQNLMRLTKLDSSAACDLQHLS